MDPARIREADTVLIAVPALVTKAKDPDISYVVSAAETVADIAIKGQNQGGRVIRHPGILIPGLTSRENVPDTRASPVRKIVHELKESDTDIYGYDRLPSPIEIERLGAKPAALLRGIRGTVGSITVYSRHSAFASLKLDALPTNRNGEPIVVDMMGMPRGSNGRVWEGCMYCTS
ncbi:UDP binding domain-containing protein [Methanoculleus sp.]|uniref:UDP binding domain-containing protein n=1 Tax=Methanoculleus sp. TaxID=90427 RepID=UPI0026015B65|nr:UDP binding domain-containing protein [Methanoculleus sp.]